MNSLPLRVLLAADDRALLCDLSRFLSMFGYEVCPAAGIAQATAAMEQRRADILLVDESLTQRVGLEFCHSLNRDPLDPAAALIWMVEDLEPAAVHDALAAGVEDILPKPVDRGELLSRLRAAGRMLEYERRAREQSGVDPATGLLSRSAFIDLAEREAALAMRRSTPHRGAEPLSCVVFDFDFFSRIRTAYGPLAERRILAAALSKLPEWCAGPLEIACLGNDRFAVLLPQFSESEAEEWAEKLRRRLRETEFRFERHAFTLTASFGVAQYDEVELLEDLLARSERAMENAKESGRDVVFCSQESSEDSGRWAAANSPEQWFQNTLARDVMIPCSVWLREHDTQAAAVELFERTGAPLLPVVNEDQRLVGAISAIEAAEIQSRPAVEQQSRQVGDAMEVYLHRESERAPFSSLMERFNADPEISIVLVENNRPTGIVTLGSLAALSAPLLSDTFAAVSYESSSRYLRVNEQFQLSNSQDDY